MIRTDKKSISKINADALIVPFFEDTEISFLENILGGSLKGIKSLFEAGEFSGREADLVLLHFPESPFKRLLLIGLGNTNLYQINSPEFSLLAPFPYMAQERLRRIGGKAFRFLQEKGFTRLAVHGELFKQIEDLTYPALYYFLEGGLLSIYQFKKFKTKIDNIKELKEIIVIDDSADAYTKRLYSIVNASMLCRDLINSPSNHITPTRLLEEVRSIKSRYLKTKVLFEKDCYKEGMMGFLAVARGSSEKPAFIIAEYKKGKSDTIVLIGKSITFDSGGISIKPSEGMDKMKYDMAGGAVVLSVLKTIADNELDAHIVAIFPATENMPDGNAYKPGDVIKMMNGKTVEIVSTDAEGRMTIADAISYGIKYYKPRYIIDIATLTGACAITFGNEMIGMMGNDIHLMALLKQSGLETYERVWEMPLCEEFGEYLKSDSADIKNSAGRNGSMLVAGYFLKEFAGSNSWVHLDIASTSWLEKDKPYLPKGASGSGMRLLVDFILNLKREK